MAKEVMSLTRDLFDEMLLAVAVKERERIIKLWELEMACDCEEAMQHLRQRIEGEVVVDG